MCVVSMVYDHYAFRFPQEWTPPPVANPTWPAPTILPVPLPDASSPDAEELRELIRDFREAVKAAKTVDRLTQQPDCEDPEKAKLEERVAALERDLARLKGGIEPGGAS